MLWCRWLRRNRPNRGWCLVVGEGPEDVADGVLIGEDLIDGGAAGCR